MGETWWEYLTRVTDRAAQVEIAKAAGVDPASVSRWKLGKNTPSADRVIAVARHFRRNPVEALVVAGYLDATEVDASIELAASADQLTDDELLSALRRRLDPTRADPNRADPNRPASGLPDNHRPASGLPDDSPPPVRSLEAARTLEAEG